MYLQSSPRAIYTISALMSAGHYHRGAGRPEVKRGLVYKCMLEFGTNLHSAGQQVRTGPPLCSAELGTCRQHCIQSHTTECNL